MSVDAIFLLVSREYAYSYTLRMLTYLLQKVHLIIFVKNILVVPSPSSSPQGQDLPCGVRT